MKRAEVLEWPLQEQLWPHMEKMKPRPSIYIPEFIAANQEERADNVLRGSMAEQVLAGRGRGGDKGRGGGATALTRPPRLGRVPGGADPQGHPRLQGEQRGGQSHRPVDGQHGEVL